MSSNTGGGDYKGVPQEDGGDSINTKRAAAASDSGAIPTARKRPGITVLLEYC